MLDIYTNMFNMLTMNIGKFLLYFAFSFIGGILGSMAENRWHFVQWTANKLGI